MDKYNAFVLIDVFCFGSGASFCFVLLPSSYMKSEAFSRVVDIC